jgi:hypothetical protein
MVAGTVAAVLLVYSVITLAWSFTLVLLVAIGVYVYVHKETPSDKEIAISADGVMYEGSLTPYAQCDGFWFVKTPNYTELHIERKKGNRGEISIHTGSLSPEEIRIVLSPFLPELSDRHERLLDTICRVCKL